MNIDSELIDLLVEEVYKRIEEKINKGINDSSVEFSSYAIVTAVNDDSSIASISFGKYTKEDDVDNSIKKVPNHSGETLAVGDKVKVFYENNNLKNIYVGVLDSKGSAPTS